MIRILDSNALNYLYKNKITVSDDIECCVPEDIRSEFMNLDEAVRWFKNCAFAELKVDESEYLTEYAHFINLYNKVSFYGMKGFGDVALLAVLSLQVKQLSKTPTLSDELFSEEVICLVSRDRNLRTFVTKLFPRVTLETPEEFGSKVSAINKCAEMGRFGS